jgi:serine/threonine protein kinase/tetratricopeptide (TPR) repeat protein
MQVLGDVFEREPGERAAALARACGDDESLLEEVERLLAREERAAAFLEESPLEAAARARAGESESLVGRRVGAYRVVREIGRGGMGAVFEAVRADDEFEKRVAVKLIKRGMDTDAILRRFRIERQILATLDHPNIARLLDGGTTADGLPYLVMEYVEGLPVNEYADAHRLSTNERLKLFRTVCAAVSYAHQNLVVHRDIKPSNILVQEDGTPKLLDFGIAKLLDARQGAGETATALRVMTPEYASPEQVRGESVTTATDIYALGVLLYELLTGRRPYRFKSRSPVEVARAVCEQEPEKPSTAVSRVERTQTGDASSKRVTPEGVGLVREGDAKRLARRLSGDLDNIVLLALRKEPERRYHSVSEFSEDIRRHLEGLTVSARRDTFAYRGAKFVRRHKVGVAAAAVVALSLVGGVIATAREAYVAQAERARAERRFNDVRALAHTFIFDLNDEIGKGPTQARAMLVERALQYLGSLAQEAGDDRALRQELASAYLKVGDLQGAPYGQNLGDVQGALASYRKAIAILEGLAADQPHDLNARRDLSDAYQKISELESRSGDWASSLESGRRSVELCEALLAADPSNVEYRMFAGRAYLSLGDTQSRVADDGLSLEGRRAALESYRRSLAIHQSLLDADPLNNELRRRVMQSHERIGFTYMGISWLDGDMENKRQSLASLKKALELSQALLDSEPSNAHFRRGLAGSWMEVGLQQSNLDDDAEAMKSYGKSQPIFEELAAADPTNLEAQRDLLNVYARAATSLAKLNDARRSQEYARRALSIFERLRAADPKNIEDRFNAELVYDSTGDVLSKAGDTAGALDNYRKAVEVNEDWLAVEPGSAKGLRALADQYAKLGGVYVMTASVAETSARRKTESWREARNWYQKSLDTWQGLRERVALCGADAGRIDETAREIAKCDAALRE